MICSVSSAGMICRTAVCVGVVVWFLDCLRIRLNVMFIQSFQTDLQIQNHCGIEFKLRDASLRVREFDYYAT